jgi:hypothetical protein
MILKNLGKVGITPRKAWSASVADYEYLDTVTDSGNLYMVVFNGFVPAGTPVTNTNYYELQASKGDIGWTAMTTVVADGARRVRQLTDYIGGTGVKPTANIGNYLGLGGYVPLIADAVDFSGPIGPTGNAVVPTWAAQVYATGAQVTWAGTNWTLGSPASAADIPGVSSKWVDQLSAKANQAELYDKSVYRLSDNVDTIILPGTTTGYIAAGGGFSASANYNVTDYAPILPQDIILYKATVAAATVKAVTLYSEDKLTTLILLDQSPNNVLQALLVPEGVWKYYRACGLITSSPTYGIRRPVLRIGSLPKITPYASQVSLNSVKAASGVATLEGIMGNSAFIPSSYVDTLVMNRNKRALGSGRLKTIQYVTPGDAGMLEVNVLRYNATSTNYDVVSTNRMTLPVSSAGVLNTLDLLPYEILCVKGDAVSARIYGGSKLGVMAVAAGKTGYGGNITSSTSFTKDAVEVSASERAACFDVIYDYELSTLTVDVDGLKTRVTTIEQNGSGGGVEAWTAKAYLTGKRVNYQGKDWTSTAAATATDIPGTASMWASSLSYYDNKIAAIPKGDKGDPGTIGMSIQGNPGPKGEPGTKGADAVVINQPGTVVTTVAVTGDWNDLVNKRFGAIINAKEFGVISDTGVDQAAKINEVISFAETNGFSAVYFPKGVYSVKSEIVAKNGVDLIGAGEDLTKITNVGAVYTNFAHNAVIYGEGTKDLVGTLSTNYPKFSGKTFVLDRSFTVKSGDVLCFTDSTPYSYDPITGRDYYAEGEFMTVREDVTASNTLLVESMNYGNYINAANTNVYKMNFLKCNISDLTVEGFSFPSAQYDKKTQGVAFMNAGNMRIKDVKVIGPNYICLNLTNCFNVKMDGIRNKKFSPTPSSNVASGVTSYGISMAGCQSCHVSNSEIFGYRHAIAITGGGNTLMVNRFNTVTTSKLSSQITWAMDFHGNSEYNYVRDCPLIEGVGVGGRFNHFHSNRIVNGFDYSAITFRELSSMNFDFIDNDIDVFGDGTQSGVMLSYVQAADGFQGGTFNFIGNRIREYKQVLAINIISFNLVTNFPALNQTINVKRNTFEFMNRAATNFTPTINIGGITNANSFKEVDFSYNTILGYDATIYRAREVTAIGNIIKDVYTDFPLDIQYADRVVLSGNKIFDFGKIAVGTPAATNIGIKATNITDLYFNNNDIVSRYGVALRPFAFVTITNLYKGLNALVPAGTSLSQAITTTIPYA